MRDTKNNYINIYNTLSDFLRFFRVLFSRPYPGMKKKLQNSREMLEIHREFCRFHVKDDFRGHYQAEIDYGKWIFEHAEEINETVNRFIDSLWMTKKRKETYKDKFYRLLFRHVFEHRKEWETDDEIIEEFLKSGHPPYSVEGVAWEAELKRLNKNCRLLAKTSSNAETFLKAQQIRKLVQKEHKKYFGNVPLKNLLELNEWLEKLLE